MFFRLFALLLLLFCGAVRAIPCNLFLVERLPRFVFFSSHAPSKIHSPRELKQLAAVESNINAALDKRDIDGVLFAIDSGIRAFQSGVVERQKRAFPRGRAPMKGARDSLFNFQVSYRQFLVETASILKMVGLPTNHPIWTSMEANLTAMAVSFAHFNGHQAEPIELDFAGEKVKGLFFSGKGDSELEKFKAQVANEVPGRTTRVVYLPGHLIRSGGSAVVAGDILAVGHEFATAFTPGKNERHEFRHVTLDGLMARGIDSPFHGVSMALDPRLPLPIHELEQYCLYHEIYSWNEPWTAYMDVYDEAQALLQTTTPEIGERLASFLNDSVSAILQAGRALLLLREVNREVLTYIESNQPFTEVYRFAPAKEKLQLDFDTYMLSRAPGSFLGCTELDVVYGKKTPVMFFITPASHLHIIPLLNPQLRKVCLDFETELRQINWYQQGRVPTTKFEKARLLLLEVAERLIDKGGQFEAIQKRTLEIIQPGRDLMASGSGDDWQQLEKQLRALEPIQATLR